MGKHEIRLRKQRLTSRSSDRYRNYGSVLKQHEEEKKIRVIVKIFTYFLIIAMLILIFFVVSRWEQSQEKTSQLISSTEFSILSHDHIQKENIENITENFLNGPAFNFRKINIASQNKTIRKPKSRFLV